MICIQYFISQNSSPKCENKLLSVLQRYVFFFYFKQNISENLLFNILTFGVLLPFLTLNMLKIYVLQHIFARRKKIKC